MVTIDDLKDHLKLPDDSDYGALERAYNGAVSLASDYLDRPIPWTDEQGYLVEVPHSVNSAILLIGQQLFDVRGAGGEVMKLGSAERHLLNGSKRWGI